MATRLEAPLVAIMFHLLGVEISGGGCRCCACGPADPPVASSGRSAQEDRSPLTRSGELSEPRRAKPQALIGVHTCTNRRGRQPPCSGRRAIMRQIKTILDQTPEGFDAQVNAAIQDL